MRNDDALVIDKAKNVVNTYNRDPRADRKPSSASPEIVKEVKRQLRFSGIR